MQILNEKHSIWFEKYLPSCVEDLILPDKMKKRIQKAVTTQKLVHLGLFSSHPGTGKSSTAHAIIREIGGEAIWINASKERGIDTIGGRLEKFASQGAFDDNIKIIVMDEFDNFTPAGQLALRGFIGEYGDNCKFIFTGNYKDKIIAPLLERLQVYDFNSFPKEEMVKPIFERLKWILEHENIKYEPRDLVPVINTFYPKIRSMVGALQQYSDDGVFTVDKDQLDDLHVFDEIMKVQKSLDTYSEMILKVNELNAPDNMIDFLYKNVQKYFKPDTYSFVIPILAECQNWAKGIRDPNLNLAAFLTKLIKYRI